MLQFKDRSNRLYKISYSSPYDLTEIKNYYDDVAVLGQIGTYDKYKDKIEEIIKHGTSNRELKPIPSVYEERFSLVFESGNDCEAICRMFTNMSRIFDKISLSKEQKEKIYSNILEEYDLKEKPIFILNDSANKNICVKCYPKLEKSSREKDDVFLSYYFVVNNNEKQIKYDKIGMHITYLTYPGEEDSIKKVLFQYEKEFCNNISPFFIDANNLDDLKNIVVDNTFYENCRRPMVALRENGCILELTKDKGMLISTLYSSENNVDKSELTSKKILEDNKEFLDLKNLEELKEYCENLVLEGLQYTNYSKPENEVEEVL